MFPQVWWTTAYPGNISTVPGPLVFIFGPVAPELGLAHYRQQQPSKQESSRAGVISPSPVRSRESLQNFLTTLCPGNAFPPKEKVTEDRASAGVESNSPLSAAIHYFSLPLYHGMVAANKPPPPAGGDSRDRGVGEMGHRAVEISFARTP